MLAANVFALLGLRALFFLVAGLLDRLVYLSVGLSVILTFIGIKLVLHFGHLQNHAIPEISTAVSLAVIVVVLGPPLWPASGRSAASRAGAPTPARSELRKQPTPPRRSQIHARPHGLGRGRGRS